LQTRWSPQQIATRLVVDFPDEPEMRVSHETIYQSLFIQSRGQFRKDLTAYLRSRRAARKPRSESSVPRGISGMINISERPAEVEDRGVPGHWEGDLIMGAGNKSAIITLVERSTRYVLLGRYPGRHDAESTCQVLTELIGRLPEQLRRSLTWDQGREMAAHAEFTIATDVAVYFCDPHSPWQRGSNENTNGLLRDYFPKGTSLARYTQHDLDAVATELNGRPRQTLEWMKPSERLNELIASTA
jgi:IS30 family transposase